MPQTAPETVARDVIVHGLVQGVFFRDSCRTEARQHHVAGWVRNEYDGTVSAHFEGTPDDVDAMVRWAHHGPRHAVVTSVDVREAEVQGLSGFEVQ